ncbi:M14 family zinc carboxypeptidase [Planctobacterium marinum]
MRYIFILVSFLFCHSLAVAGLWPGAKYDEETPTLQSLYGYKAGEKLSNTTQIEGYLTALSKAHPDKIQVLPYGQSWQGRTLNYAVISSAANLARLDEIRAQYLKFADPRKTNKRAMQTQLAQLPSIVWLGYGVHGNEVSSPDAALQVAYHLLASDDAMVKEILDNVIVLLDPVQNPDGREKFIHHFENNTGPEANGHAFATERREGWNTGRTNHYIFDLNRDWAAITQPETLGRVKLLSQWLPLIAVDLHEFGSDYTYYFTPEADPFNPYITEVQKQGLEIIGKNNAKYFDQQGWRYFTREIYDAFFPGYGAGWPVFYGALGMTYEQASPRGLKATNKLGETFTYRDAVEHHFVASVATLETAAKHRALFLQRFWEYRESAITEGDKGDVRQIILARSDDPYNTDRLAKLLSIQGIELSQAQKAFKACGNTFAAGDYIIDMAQPNYRMIRNYLDQHIPMEKDFLALQEDLRRQHKSHVLYDVTAWSKRLTHNVAVHYCNASPAATSQPLDTQAKAEVKQSGDGELAWLIDWQHTGSALFLVEALQSDIEIWSSDKSFTQHNRTFPKGSLIIYKKAVSESGKRKLQELAAKYQVELVSTNSGWVDKGVNFGSQHVVKMKSPNIALLWERPTSSYLAGATRYVFEQQLNHPVNTIAARYLNSVDLFEFDVLILPGGGNYASYINKRGLEKLNTWLRQGGVIVALDSSIAFLTDNQLSQLQVEENQIDARKSQQEPVSGVIANASQYEALQVDPKRPMASSPGNILKVQPNTDHWMMVGINRPVYSFASGNVTYKPLHRGEGVNVAHYADADSVLASGYLWQDYNQQLAFKPFMTLEDFGDGMVISMPESPTFRGQQPGLHMLWVNAIWRSVAHTKANIRNGK